MKTIKLTRDSGWKYRTEDGVLVGFEECTIGKYKGKTFMGVYSESTTENGYPYICEEYLLEVKRQIRFHDVQRTFGDGYVRVLEEIEVDEKQLSRKDVFFNFARKTKFSIDESKSFEGYTFNQYWNGWDCPYFTKEVAMEVCDEFSYKYDDEEECRCFYDECTDTFYCEDWNNDYERQEIGHPTEINTEEGKIKVYNFGYACWIWSEDN